MGETINEFEQQERYNELAKKTSGSLAYFYCCIQYDVPFARDCVPLEETEECWIDYLDNLKKAKLDKKKNGKPAKFVDGLTDIVTIFGNRLEQGEFSTALIQDQNVEKAKSGSNEQKKNWGLGDPDNPYTRDDYMEFDRIYKILSLDLGGEESLSAKQQLILRNVAKWTKQMNDYTNQGNIKDAKQLSALIQENLASDNLRKKDVKPVETLKLDGITDRLEKSGLMKNGKKCNPTELFYRFFGFLPECKFCQIKDTDKCKYEQSIVKGKYPYTADAADQIILINENRMRQNDGQPELAFLPENMRINDELGEFASEPNDAEIEAYEKIGLVPMPKKERN